ncbi:hypothetical protein GUJ93_ZPchr0006g43193 [Zizania palustris]|uniref:CCHC-type domain-containing protein n=1 Tax=Zizania palustris TaxID=103762 RepID=A0A8J5T7E8_ZIZPA|nr:hypothetical protein GUJ93_ZPchr0006g43193 [Zizania palustris]
MPTRHEDEQSTRNSPFCALPLFRVRPPLAVASDHHRPRHRHHRDRKNNPHLGHPSTDVEPRQNTVAVEDPEPLHRLPWPPIVLRRPLASLKSCQPELQRVCSKPVPQASKIPLFDGTDFAYWKVRMEAYLLSQGNAIWEIVDSQYSILDTRTSQTEKDQYNANSKARNIMFIGLSRNQGQAPKHIQSQYQLFVQAPGESINAMFSHFDAIVSNLRSNGTLAYNDHDRAIKLLYALDRSIWEVKISSIEESAGYDTLTCDELFSKLKSTEIAKASLAVHRNSLPQPLALVSSTSRGTAAEPSTSRTCVLADGFALSSLVSVTKEQVDTLDDDELALIARRFTRFHHERRDQRRSGFSGCFECGDTSHIKANCPKIKNRDESERPKYHKKERKPFVKGKHGKVAKRVSKAASRAFVAALSDIDTSSTEESSSEEEESPRKEDKKDKKGRDFTGLCFMADSDHSGD